MDKLIYKGAILVDQNGAEWVAVTDTDSNGEFRCANATTLATGSVRGRMVVKADQ